MINARRRTFLLRALATLLLGAGLCVLGQQGYDWYWRVDRLADAQRTLDRELTADWDRLPARSASQQSQVWQGPAGQRSAGTTGTDAIPADSATVDVDPTGSGAAQPRSTAQPGPAAQPGPGQPGPGQPGPGQPAPGQPAPGQPIARLRLPTLRLSLVVVEGATESDLMHGPGRIAGTQRFGEEGNVGVAGHRYPGIFWDLDRLRPGDPIEVETADVRYTYRVTVERIVDPAEVDVLAAPGTGSAPLLTLVTCDPKFTTMHRLVRQAELVAVGPRLP